MMLIISTRVGGLENSTGNSKFMESIIISGRMIGLREKSVRMMVKEFSWWPSISGKGHWLQQYYRDNRIKEKISSDDEIK